MAAAEKTKVAKKTRGNNRIGVNGRRGSLGEWRGIFFPL